MRNEKKGISPIIATVLIVAITVAAGLILFATIQPLIRESIAASDCLDITFELDTLSTCYDTTTQGTPPDGSLHVAIDRTRSGTDEPRVIGWQVIANDGAGEKTALKVTEVDTPDIWKEINPGNQKTLLIPYDEFDLDAYYGVQTYPIIQAEQVQESCPAITREIKQLSPCP